MISNSFVWGEDGKAITPDEAKRRREIAMAMVQAGTANKPIQHWTQGAANVAQALMGAYDMRQIDKQEAAAREASKASDAALLSAMGGANAAPAAMAPAAPPSGGVATPPGNIPQGMRASPDLIKMIEERNAQANLPAGYLARTAQIESGMNPAAKNPNSSAAGLFQFIDSTRRQYGNFDPMDPAASTEAAARLAANNRAVLAQALGREPSAAELYLAHQQGAGGASRLLANPNARAVDIVGADAVRLNGGNANMTAGEFANKWISKFGGGQQTPAEQVPTPAQQVAQANPALLSKAMERMNDPYASPGSRAVAQALVQRLIAQETKDPRDAMLKEAQLEGARLGNEKARRDLGRTEMETMQAPDGTVFEREKGKPGAQWRESLKLPSKPEDRTADQRELAQANEERKAAGLAPLRMDEYKTQKAKAGATNINNDITGGTGKQVFDAIKERSEMAQTAVTGLNSLREARRAVESGGFFGAGADQRLAFAKLGQLFGFEDGRVTNTETFRSAIAPQVAAMMKATVGSTQISNADREFAEKAAGGSIALDQKSITRLLDIMERGSMAVIERHQKTLDAVYPETQDGKFARERALFSIQVPVAPAAPTNAAPGNLEPAAPGKILRYNPQTGALE